MAKFCKGISGNPGGRPKLLAGVQELARLHAPSAITELARLALRARSETARIAAIRELLDRGYGRPRQAILRAKRHLHSRPSLKSVQILRPPHDCAEPTRERAWSILVRLYQIAAIPFPGQQLNTKIVPQGMQTNCHHARSRLHPRALT